MGEVFFGLPENLARAVVREMGLRGAVETGTHLGDSAVKLREFVPEVWTVELSEAYVERARERHRDADGVHFLQGSSDVVLRELAPTFTDPMLYWLDAHWCEVDTAGSDRQCPVLGEIAALDEAPSAADSVILIDDARFFLGAPWPTYRREDWPTFMQIADALRARHPRYVTTIQDVIVAGPPHVQGVVETYWQGLVFGRLMSDREWLHNEKERLLRETEAAAERENQLRQRATSLENALAREWSPTPLIAARRMVKALTPAPLWTAVRRRRGTR